MYKATAFDLNLALLQYWRFKRGCVCVEEFRGADIIVDTGGEVIEIEVKISKNDLINGEKRKHRKHQSYKENFRWVNLRPNKYMFCVPKKLCDVALEFAKEINPNYGVIYFNTERFEEWVNGERYYKPHMEYLNIVRSAKKMHDTYNDKLRWDIAKGTSAKIATVNERLFKDKLKGEK